MRKVLLLLLTTSLCWGGALTTTLGTGNVSSAVGTGRMDTVGNVVAAAGWSLLSSVQYNLGSAGTTSAIDTQTGGPATLLIACIDCYDGANPSDSCGISDSHNNGWTNFGSDQTNGSARLEIYYSSNPIVGTSHTFTNSGNTGSAQSYGFQVGAFTGAKISADPFDQHTGNVGTGTSLAAGNITPSVSGELLITCLQSQSAWTTDSVTINNGTVVYQNVFNTGVVYGNGFSWYSDPTTSAINQTFSWTTSANGNDVAVASFEPGP